MSKTYYEGRRGEYSLKPGKIERFQAGLARRELRTCQDQLVHALLDRQNGNQSRWLSPGNAFALYAWFKHRTNIYDQLSTAEKNKLIAEALYNAGSILLTKPTELQPPTETPPTTYQQLQEEISNTRDGYALIEGNDEEGFRQDLQEQLNEIGAGEEYHVDQLPLNRHRSKRAQLFDRIAS